MCAAFILTFYDPIEKYQSNREDCTNYEIAKAQLITLRGTQEPLILFLHGPGGSGKSTCVELVVEYARDFCRLLEHPFTSRTIIVTAMSGVAATLLMGETTHSVFGLNREKISSEEIEKFADTWLSFIDEISFAGKQDFEKLDSNCRAFMQQKDKKYGGLDITFLGDMSQMEPVQKETMYSGVEVPEFHHFVNAFVELDGMHRFADDVEWGHINMRIRAGCPTKEDIQKINDTCLVSNTHKPPKGIQVATYTNKDRDAINCAIFEEFCIRNKPVDGSTLKCAVLVFMDNLAMQESTKTWHPITSNREQRFFWGKCGENNCCVGKTSGKGRVDPVLKLYYNCPLMYTRNTDVLSGKANGSRVRFQVLYLKHGEEMFDLKLECGTTISAVYASQVHSIQVKQENPKMIPEVFELRSCETTFNAKMEIGTEVIWQTMRGTQFPIISNTATTGHKLQGSTLASLLVKGWYYGKNWAYVVLSRVRTMAGLFMSEPLSLDINKYKPKEEMLEMMQKFRDEKTLAPIEESLYREMKDFSETYSFIENNNSESPNLDLN